MSLAPNGISYKYKTTNIDQLIHNWWSEFATKTNDLDRLFSGKKDWDLPDWMHQHLSPIDEQLMWEYGPGLTENNHRLVITPESAFHLRPLVDKIVAQAPKLDGWEFYTYRLAAEDFDEIDATLEGRTGAPCMVRGVSFERDRFNRIGINVHFDKKILRNKKLVDSQTFIFIETLLGEENLDKWVGFIEPCAETDDMISSDDARDAFTRFKQQIKDELPEKPLYVSIDEGEWAGLELQDVEQASDYYERDDVFVASSGYLDFIDAAMSHYMCFDERFSRNNETFCYLKMDGSQGVENEKFGDRSEIEEALDSVLIKNNLGCTMGGATGYRYSYIDFALTDFNAAAENIRQVLQEGNLSKRSWLLFFDPYRKTQWMGIWDDSPTPLLREG